EGHDRGCKVAFARVHLNAGRAQWSWNPRDARWLCQQMYRDRTGLASFLTGWLARRRWFFSLSAAPRQHETAANATTRRAGDALGCAERDATPVPRTPAETTASSSAERLALRLGRPAWSAERE